MISFPGRPEQLLFAFVWRQKGCHTEEINGIWHGRERYVHAASADEGRSVIAVTVKIQSDDIKDTVLLTKS